MLYSNVLSYFALNNVQDELSARSADIVTYRAPSLGLFRTQLVPLYQWGVAKEVSFPGMVMDIDQMKTVTISKDFDLDKYRAFNQSQGTRYSYMEGFVPEQFFSTDEAPAQAVSAVSAISQASAEGQKILTITPDNQALTLPLLTIDQIAKDEIMAGLNAGMIITTHEAPVTVGSWQGSGYIILDPDTGAGAYKISGGENGGILFSLGASFGALVSIGFMVYDVPLTNALSGQALLAVFGVSMFLLSAVVALILLSKDRKSAIADFMAGFTFSGGIVGIGDTINNKNITKPAKAALVIGIIGLVYTFLNQFLT